MYTSRHASINAQTRQTRIFINRKRYMHDDNKSTVSGKNEKNDTIE